VRVFYKPPVLVTIALNLLPFPPAHNCSALQPPAAKAMLRRVATALEERFGCYNVI